MQILIIDDHPLTCQGLSALLLSVYPQAAVRAVNTAHAARQALRQTPPTDWLFLDIQL